VTSECIFTQCHDVMMLNVNHSYQSFIIESIFIYLQKNFVNLNNKQELLFPFGTIAIDLAKLWVISVDHTTDQAALNCYFVH